MVRLLALLGLLCVTVTACGTQPADDRSRGTNDAPARHLDPQQVPADLTHLVPLAERWGIGDDVERNARVDRATPADREELRAALQPHQARITGWLDSFGQGAMTDEAAAFMYMQLALEEMQADTQR
jgi:hypothetical protein